MIAQTELEKILTWNNHDFKKSITGWGVVHCVQWLGDLNKAMAEYAKKHPYEHNVLRDFYVDKVRLVEVWAYERFVINRRRELYRENPLYLSKQQELKARIRKEFNDLKRRYYH